MPSDVAEPEPASGSQVAGAEPEAVYDIPIEVRVVLGKTTMQVRQLLKLGRGAVVELDGKRDEPVGIYVNDRMVARGEVIIVNETTLGVSITKILRSDFS